ncbi:DUF4942 domain-containing protein [Hymenobacter siberiensis]|uniref:DUF4942 domain-containing protein n=1 Tax=Hymenobacter siberiensis TaxID=2848396 RepID=UPI001C1E8970|nr:DUF4942 domain-containing protein [Hymenobacter siberiensis]
MFDNPDFYPTPPEVIARMLEPYKATPHDPDGRRPGYRPTPLSKWNILEPHGGKGDILDYLVEEKAKGHYYDSNKAEHRKKLYTIERDPELRALLQGKGYRVIGEDFLDYHGDLQFDLIIANPPFSSGVKQVLHCWDIIAAGGQVVSLLNADNLKNPYSEERQLLLDIIEQHGSWEELGNVFTTAERTTDVNTALIRLTKPESATKFDFDFGTRHGEHGPDFTADNLKDGVAMRDLVGNMIMGFDKTKAEFIEYMKARERLTYWGADIKGVNLSVLTLAEAAIAETKGDKKNAYNEFITSVTAEMWQAVIGKLDMQQLMTHKVREDFTKFSKSQGYMDFTKRNVASMVEMLFDNKHNILEQAVVQVFDMFTDYHKENRLHVEGWKTNSAWKVNRKVILPYWVALDEWSGFSISHRKWSQYSDIDKAMCHLTGTRFDADKQNPQLHPGCHTIEEALRRKFKVLGRIHSGPFDGTCESQFFDLRFFKKGTLHITFKDEHLWQEFNLRACAGKNFLPPKEEEAFRQRTHSPFEPAPAPGPEPEAHAMATAVPERVMLQLAAPAPVVEAAPLPEPTVDPVGQFALF